MFLAGRIENFKEYSKFSSIKEFNNTIEMFLSEHKKRFHERRTRRFQTPGPILRKILRCSQRQDRNAPKSHQ